MAESAWRVLWDFLEGGDFRSDKQALLFMAEVESQGKEIAWLNDGEIWEEMDLNGQAVKHDFRIFTWERFGGNKLFGRKN